MWYNLTLLIIPLLAVIVSWLLASKNTNKKYDLDLKKEIYNNYYCEILKICHGLPSPNLLDFFSFLSFYQEEKLSKIILDNFIYIDPSILKYWKQYNLALKIYNHETHNDYDKKIILKSILNYYSHIILIKSLEKSEQLSKELKLPQLSTPLLSPLWKIDDYKSELPTIQVLREYNLPESLLES
ncbi:hypothetical protein CPU09_02580 [Mammaliicoccus sciuri]|nr:hypothetical protein CPU09_02580 [Mammaliicoccus sciuri]